MQEDIRVLSRSFWVCAARTSCISCWILQTNSQYSL